MGKKNRRAEVDFEPDENVDVKRTKKKKKKHKCDQSSENINKNEFKDEHCTLEITSKSAYRVKKKKRDRHEEQGELNGTVVESTEDKLVERTKSFQLETVKEKKRKKKLNGDATPTNDEQESKIEHENEGATSESDKVKKKRKRKKLNGDATSTSDEQESKIEHENEEATSEINKVKRKKKKTKQRDHDIVIENKYFFDDSDSPKEKPNGNHKTGSSSTSVTEPDDLDAYQNEAIKKKKKKRKRKDDCSEKIDTPVETHPVVVESESPVKKVKKRKKSKDKDHVLVTDNDSYKKKSEEDSRDYLNGKKSNEETTAIVGQWGTAQFDNSERQNKFFRLLGGMKNQGTGGAPAAMNQGKKGLFGGLAALVPKTGKNAMTNEQQTDWQTKMESQFDKALTYKFQKGGGLGFEKPPEEGKKFHINIHKSNSIKFDDD